MKKITALLACLFLLAATLPACAVDDRPIPLTEVPSAAQQFVKTHFSALQPSYATVDGMFDKEYRIYFPNGWMVEFDRKGAWKEVVCRPAAIPDAIIPQQIRDVVAKNHPGVTIGKIERDSRGYDVELSNGLDLEFDNAFNLIKIDN